MTARVEAGARTCEQCGKPFERRTSGSGRLEDASQFARRRFCSRACFRDACAAGFRVRPPGVWLVKPSLRALKFISASESTAVPADRARTPDGTRQRAAVAVTPPPGPRTARTVPRPAGVRP